MEDGIEQNSKINRSGLPVMLIASLKDMDMRRTRRGYFRLQDVGTFDMRITSTSERSP